MRVIAFPENVEALADQLQVERAGQYCRGWLMYASYFGLREEPFGLTPNPAFLYLSPCHRAALAILGDGLLDRRGLLLLVGEVGTGKTTLLYSLLGRIDPQIDVAFVAHTTQTFEELLAAALEDLQVEASSDSKDDLVSALNAYVQRRGGEGRTVALVVDEAQNLTDQAFEEFRLLSTSGTSRDLLQIVLVGQPEFENRLRQPPLLQLREQASVCAFVTPLSAREMERYIGHRLEFVGGSVAALFAPSALRQIVRRTEGIPRRANILCHNALLFAYGRALPRVTPQIAREVIAEMDGRRPGLLRRQALERVATRSLAMRPVAANAVGALREIVRRTERIPRRVHALLFGYGREHVRALKGMRAAAAGAAAAALVAASHAAFVGLGGDADGPRASLTTGATLRIDGGPMGPPPAPPAPSVDDDQAAGLANQRVTTTSGEMAVPEAPTGFCLTSLRSRHGVTPYAFAVPAVHVRNSTVVAPEVLLETRPSSDRKRAGAVRKLPSRQPRAGSQTAGGTPPRTERLTSAGGRSSSRLRSPRQTSKPPADRVGIFKPVVRFLDRVFKGPR